MQKKSNVAHASTLVLLLMFAHSFCGDDPKGSGERIKTDSTTSITKPKRNDSMHPVDGPDPIIPPPPKCIDPITGRPCPAKNPGKKGQK
jgi:hypothetical protein